MGHARGNNEHGKPWRNRVQRLVEIRQKVALFACNHRNTIFRESGLVNEALLCAEFVYFGDSVHGFGRGAIVYFLAAFLAGLSAVLGLAFALQMSRI